MQEEVIELGKKLVQELSKQGDDRITTKWTSSYLAERINEAEKAKGTKKERINKECFDLIMKIWQHRANLPNRARPLEEIEKTIEVLHRIGSDTSGISYHRRRGGFQPKLESLEHNPTDANGWLDLALALDQIVKIWRHGIFKNALSCATDEETTEYLKHILDLPDDDEVRIFIGGAQPFLKELDVTKYDSLDVQKDKMENKIATLKLFNEVNKSLMKNHKEELSRIKKELRSSK